MTGAAGFLGGHAAAALRADGWEVAEAGRPEMEVPSAAFDALLRETNPRLVVHCAGPASVPASVADPAGDFSGAVGTTFEVLERLRDSEAAFVLVSSAAVYGQPEGLPVAEDAPLRPISPYGFHRLLAEDILREYHELWGLRGCVLRVFSAYGEGLRRQILWDVCAKAVRDGAVALDGTGAESRDFVHGSDVGRAVAAVAREAPLEAEAYNVASGRETRLDELVPLLLDALGSDVPVTFSGRLRPGDPRNWRADLGRLAGLGFEPTVPIDTGARRYAEWARRELA